ncbi:hypothetical protein LTR78_003476 [Recurvomyces mirabilis]|uniref:Uncharacterized protein n=1 Tax=Recurvomyces mirabilis TaxID=574656 RepID=A0AAE1C3M4_9PEZI|nr:hypothetical protein LTR78_003476 [Recurvomyces mirabilis]
MTNPPNPQTWTLRLKHSRTTILLHVSPLQPFSSVRTELLRALHQTNPSGILNSHEIPQHESEVLLARPVDNNDLSLGWETLEAEKQGEGGEEGGVVKEDKKGKGKAGAVVGAAKSGGNKATDCPQGAGLRDGGVLAFKFRSEVDVEKSKRREGGDAVIDIDAEILNENKPEQWDVIVPSMEETYGGGGGEGEGLPFSGGEEAEVEGIGGASRLPPRS